MPPKKQSDKDAATPAPLFYRISKLAKMFNVNQSLLRYYQTEFDIIDPKRNKKGNRMYTPKDIEAFKLIFHLINDRGFTIPGAKEMIKKSQIMESRGNLDVISTLKSAKELLLELKEQLGN